MNSTNCRTQGNEPVLMNHTPWGSADEDAFFGGEGVTSEHGLANDVVEVLDTRQKGSAVDIRVEDINMSTYTKSKIQVSVDKIREPEIPWRALHDVAIPVWKQILQSDGYDDLLGVISVVLPDVSKVANFLLTLGGEESVQYSELVVVDGRHRLKALREIVKDGKSSGNGVTDMNPVSSRERGNINVLLWRRKDGRAVSTLEQLSIAEFCNRTSARVKRADFMDRVYAAVSTVKALVQRFGMGVDQIVLRQLAEVFRVTNTVGSMSARNCERYAYIALRFGKRPTCFKIFQEARVRESIQMVHLNSKKLFELSDEAFALALEVLERRALLNIRSAFLPVRDVIYAETEKILGTVEAVAAEQGRNVSEVLSMEVQDNGQDNLSLRKCIVRILALIEIPKANMIEKKNENKSREAMLSRHLARLFPVTADQETVLPASQAPSQPSRSKVTMSSTPAAPALAPLDEDTCGVQSPIPSSPQPAQSASAPQVPSRSPPQSPPQSLFLKATDRLPPAPPSFVVAGAYKSTSVPGTELVPPHAPHEIRGAPRNSDATVIGPPIVLSESEFVAVDETPSVIYDSTRRTRCSKRVRSTVPMVQVEQRGKATRRPKKRRRIMSRRGNGEKQTGWRHLSKSDMKAALSEMAPKDISDLFADLDADVVVKVVESMESSIRIAQRRTDVDEEGENNGGTDGHDVGKNRKQVTESSDQDLRKFVASESQFNDEVPRSLPAGVNDSIPYSGMEFPRWCEYATEIPSRWPKAPQLQTIEHCTPFLKALHMPNEHRSHVFLQDAEVLRRNHHMVFWRAAFNAYRSSGLPPAFDVSRGPFSGVKGRDRMCWAAAISRDDAAKEFFGECRQQLESKGYCTLSGMLDDMRMPSKIGTFKVPKIDDDGSFWQKLQEYMLSTLPDFREVSKREVAAVQEKMWYSIVNRGYESDRKDAIQGAGRYTTSCNAVMSALEREDTREFGRARSIVDVRIGQALAALKIHPEQVRAVHNKLYAPRTGGRWLMTSEGCKRQQLHTDFPTLTNRELMSRKNPGYFTISTGEHAVPLWVCPHSHMLVATASDENIDALSKATFAIPVEIPPYSIFVGRGDMFHAGAAFTDSASGSGLLRYHMYFVPTEYQLEDGIHLLVEFTPKFKRKFGSDNEGFESNGEEENEESEGYSG